MVYIEVALIKLFMEVLQFDNFVLCGQTLFNYKLIIYDT